MNNEQRRLINHTGDNFLVYLDGRHATGPTGIRYNCNDPENRPNAYSQGVAIGTWFLTVPSVAPWCGKCGARYEVFIHDEYRPPCSCGAAASDCPVTMQVFQLEDVKYNDQYGFERVERRKSKTRTIRLIGVESRKKVLVYVAVDDEDNVYTKGLSIGTIGWHSGKEYWADRYSRRLIPCT